jgi:ATP synthase protein I
MPGANFHGRNVGNSYARFLYLGFTFILILGILTTLGFFVDRLFGTLPLFLLVGLGIGFAAGLYYVFRSLGDLGGG